MTNTSANPDRPRVPRDVRRNKPHSDLDDVLIKMTERLKGAAKKKEAEKAALTEEEKEEKKEKLKQAYILIAALVPMGLLNGLLTRYLYRNIVQQLFPTAPAFSKMEIRALTVAVGWCAAVPTTLDNDSDQPAVDYISKRLGLYGAFWVMGAWYGRRLRRRVA